MKKKGFNCELKKRTGSVEWYTPPWIFENLAIDFDLDPCAPSGGLPWIPAKKFYSLPQDGLTLPWNGRVWLNPPYGNQTSLWLERMHRHRNGIALVFSRTDCSWYHDYVATADAILFLRGRVLFVNADNNAGKSRPGCGSMLVAWGRDCVEALSLIQGDLKKNY